MIPNEETYVQTQKNTDLVSMVSKYLTLTPGRRADKGTCPFHHDPGQSLMVSAEKNIFKCFGCGQEGGPVEFLMNIKGISRSEAIKQLLQDSFPIPALAAGQNV